MRRHASCRPLQVHVEEFIAAALDQRKVLTGKTVSAIFGGCPAAVCWQFPAHWCQQGACTWWRQRATPPLLSLNCL